ncbi:MAG: hypothetical protein LUD16_03445 [Lachnospiraceae bacterium]|nr:hypothetical protein [Lachnospiraceae bacterium]
MIAGIMDYEKTSAVLQLASELTRGERAGEKEGWLSADKVRDHFREKTKLRKEPDNALGEKT